MKYKIFSTSGEYTDDDAPIIGDAARDVQVILQWTDEVPPRPYFQTGGDYYIMWPGQERWVAVDDGGFFDFALEMGWYNYDTPITKWASDEVRRKAILSGCVLIGRTITNVEYTTIYQRANVEKHTWLAGERRPNET